MVFLVYFPALLHPKILHHTVYQKKLPHIFVFLPYYLLSIIRSMIVDVVTLLPLLTRLKMPRFLGTCENCKITFYFIVHTRAARLLHMDLFHPIKHNANTTLHSLHIPPHHIRDNLTVPMYHYINLCTRPTIHLPHNTLCYFSG